MEGLELFLVGLGLSMDAFTASICQGVGLREMRKGWVIAGTFGGFQALMPLLGWLLGAHFAQRFQQVSHVLAFFLLGMIGCGMIWEALQKEEIEPAEWQRGLLPLAVATSLDALAAGVSFAVLEVPILFAITVIGSVTFVVSFLGVWIGRLFGMHWQRWAELFGGGLLILLGGKILLGGGIA